MVQRRFIVALVLVSIPFVSPPPASGQPDQAAAPVSIVKLSPPSPATLDPGEDVEINFRYKLRARTSFRIFIRPMTGSEVSRGYSASGSPLYESGAGDGTARFTLEQAGRVDRLRIVVVEGGTDRHLHRSYVDVDYRFAPPMSHEPMQIEVARPEATAAADETSTETELERPVQLQIPEEALRPAAQRFLQLPTRTLEQLGTYEPPYWRPLPGVDQSEPEPSDDGIPSCQDLGVESRECEQVDGRRVTADGVVILDCVDGSTWRTTPQGDVFTAPDGRSCRPRVGGYKFVLAIRGTALPPAEPPPGESATSWVEQLNTWLEQRVAFDLLLRIQLLLGDEHFANYQKLEADSTDNLYHKIDYRLAFLDKLREGQ